MLHSKHPLICCLSSLTHHSAELQGHYALGKNLAEHGPQVSSHDIGDLETLRLELESSGGQT